MNDKPEHIKKKEETLNFLNKIKNLPMIPKVIFNVTKMLEDPTMSTYALSSEIGKDQGLTAKVLSIANSPMYGLQRKVTSLEFAIVVLGYKEMSDIVTAISLADTMKVTTDKYFNQEEFWLHSLVVGTASKNISHNLGHLDIGSDAFVAGILHDIGIQIIHKFLHPKFIEIIELVKKENMFLLDAELNVLGLTHQDIGGYLAVKWNLPETLISPISYHHQPANAQTYKTITAIVHLADYMAQFHKMGSFNYGPELTLDESIIETLKFSNIEELGEFILNYKDLYSQTIASVRL
ncbi:MAG: HDOD domain-containing protein [Ignavibacteriales bacterium]|nr:MAG: HDOD domain-containing protein [Ignavibacteriales bacterium]